MEAQAEINTVIIACKAPKKRLIFYIIQLLKRQYNIDVRL